MTPDRLRGWLAKVPKGAVSLDMSVDVLAGLETLGTWDRQDVIDSKGTDTDVADAIIIAADEHTAGEEGRQKFFVRWFAKRGKVLSSAVHWASPKLQSEGDELAASSMSELVVREIIRSNNNKDKVLLDALRAAGDANKTAAEVYEKTIAMLSKRLEAAHEMIEEKKLQLEATTDPQTVVISEIAEAEMVQRTEALKAVTDKLPDLLDFLITAGSTKLLESKEAAKVVADAATGGDN